jgi:hypothetical protein
MRRPRVLLWLVVLAGVPGWFLLTTSHVPPSGVRPALQAQEQPALPAANRLRLPQWVAGATEPRGGRGETFSGAHPLGPDAPALDLRGPLPSAGEEFPAACGLRAADDALPYFPTGPPLLP